MNSAKNVCPESEIIRTMSRRQERTSEDVRFERKVRAAYGPLCELYFYAKLAGVMDPNWDRTSRQAAIRNLAAAQPLYLQPESTQGRTGILMVNANGRGVGYLEAPIAEEVGSSLREGRQWHAHVRHIEQVESGERWDVVVMLLLMVTPERYAQLVEDRRMLQDGAGSLQLSSRSLSRDFSVEWTLFAVLLLGVAITML